MILELQRRRFGSPTYFLRRIQSARVASERKIVPRLFAFILLYLAAGCTRGSPPEWPAAQKADYKARCYLVANDIYNSIAVGMDERLDVEAICRCAQAEASRLFPSYGDWSVVVEKARMSRTSRDRYLSELEIDPRTFRTGPFSLACLISLDPGLSNWCAELGRCAEPEKEKHKRGEARH